MKCPSVVFVFSSPYRRPRSTAGRAIAWGRLSGVATAFLIFVVCCTVIRAVAADSTASC